MAALTNTKASLSDPATVTPKWVRILRAAVLLAIGFAVTFSATMHEQFTFDLTVISVGMVLIGCAHLVEWATRRGAGGTPVPLLFGIVGVVAGVLVFTIRIESTLAIIVAAWAVASALLEFVGMTVFPGTRQDAPLIGAAGVLLAITVLLARNDLVAVIGFFGAYAIIAGVFLGIAAFDSRRDTVAADPETELSAAASLQTTPAAEQK